MTNLRLEASISGMSIVGSVSESWFEPELAEAIGVKSPVWV